MSNLELKCKKTTEEEKKINSEKGCVNPADGTPKKCLVKVINCKKGDVTRRENSIVYNKNKNNENNLENYPQFNLKNWIMMVGLLLILNLIILKTIGKKFLLKYL